MPSVSTNDLKNGMTLNLPEGLVSVVEFQHVKPGKGGAFVRTKLKNVRTGAVIERTYRADEKLDQALVDKRPMQFLYLDGEGYVFMDNNDYEQLTTPREALGSSADYLKEGDSAVLQMFDGEIVGVDLPASVELTVTETEPGVQGDRVSGARKPATLETGLQLQVPLFVNTGDRIKVDTRSGEYLTRGQLSRVAVGTRRESRERALSLLYEADAKSITPTELLADLPVEPDPFVVEVVLGVERRGAQIDALIARFAIDWTMDRMPVVDRTLLRMATFELIDRPDVPTGVVISEAVALAKEYSTEESGRFVNGVLAAIAVEARSDGAAERPGPPE